MKGPTHCQKTYPTEGEKLENTEGGGIHIWTCITTPYWKGNSCLFKLTCAQNYMVWAGVWLNPQHFSDVTFITMLFFFRKKNLEGRKRQKELSSIWVHVPNVCNEKGLAEAEARNTDGRTQLCKPFLEPLLLPARKPESEAGTANWTQVLKHGIRSKYPNLTAYANGYTAE